MDTPMIVQNDSWLEPFAEQIANREKQALKKEAQLTQGQSLVDFASGHLYFGLHRSPRGWVFREWAPNATEIFLIGTFSGWKLLDEYALQRVSNGTWELFLAEDFLKHGDLYRLLIRWQGGEGDRIPSYAHRIVQDEQTKIFSAQVWHPDQPFKWSVDKFTPRQEPPIVFESHVGMATEEFKVGSFTEFRDNIIPYVKQAGYNTLQLMAIQEHPYYGSFGYHVSNFFAVSSRFGSPDDLKSLIDRAHQEGVAVIMDLVHSHSVKNVAEGLNIFDGTTYQYFHEGPKREHPAWDSLCFNYGKNEVLHFLLSNCQYWLEEYHFDGFRFDGITSMLYEHHGLSRDFTEYSMYFDGSQDQDAISYLILANKLIHKIRPHALCIAEEMSGMPGIATPTNQGGMGFDYRLAMGTPDYWIKLIKDRPDESWDVGEIYYELTRKRADEKTIGYVESHDQALVGDQTLIFRLIGKDMYNSMTIKSRNLVVERGIALHKMIRLITLATAGNGYLNFMGNEFGHPEWIDFPREGNNWSYQHARRQWSLVQDKRLRFHSLADFDRSMIDLIVRTKRCFESSPQLLHDNKERQILAFKRGGLLFVFNFHPNDSYTDYGVQTEPGKYRILLNTDHPKFGGFGLIDDHQIHFTGSLYENQPKVNDFVKLYLPARSALVLERIPTPSLFELM